MNTENIFPDLSVHQALETSPIKLAGQKILFDKKVALMPVELEKKNLLNEPKNR